MTSSYVIRGCRPLGSAKVDITNREGGPVNDPLWVKALVINTADAEKVKFEVFEGK